MAGWGWGIFEREVSGGLGALRGAEGEVAVGLLRWCYQLERLFPLDSSIAWRLESDSFT